MSLAKCLWRNLIGNKGQSAHFVKNSLRHFASGPFEDKLYQIPYVTISGEGEFRYMLLLAYNHGETGLGRLIVRGFTGAKHHKDIYRAAKKEVEAKELCLLPKGGGRLIHKPDECYIELFGKSKEYGKPDHEEAKEILMRQFPSYFINIKKRKM